MRTRIFVGVVALAAAQVGAVPSARAAATEATVIDAGGCVREASGPECRAVAGGTMVAVQGSFVAGKMGSRIRLGDGSELTLAPDTEVQVLPTLRLALGGSGSVRGPMSARGLPAHCRAWPSEAQPFPTIALERAVIFPSSRSRLPADAAVAW